MSTYLPFVVPTFFFGIGAILASFAGVISERLHTGESWVNSRSKCNSCSRVLSVPDLVPIISWVFTQGRCRSCKSAVPYLYPLAELILGSIFLAAYLAFAISLELFLLDTFFFILAVIVLYDLRHTVVPFSLSTLLMGIGGITAYVMADDLHALGGTLITAGVIALGFFLMHVLSSGRWMGLGDAPIALALSLIAGRYSLTGLLFSFWIGAAIGIFILVLAPRGHRMGIEVPFVPFLAAGYLLAFFTQWNLFGFM